MLWDRFKRKRQQEFFIVDFVDVFQAPKKRLPPSLVNVLIVAGIVLYIWIVNR
jgi:hypothetical protein